MPSWRRQRRRGRGWILDLFHHHHHHHDPMIPCDGIVSSWIHSEEEKEKNNKMVEEQWEPAGSWGRTCFVPLSSAPFRFLPLVVLLATNTSTPPSRANEAYRLPSNGRSQGAMPTSMEHWGRKEGRDEQRQEFSRLRGSSVCAPRRPSSREIHLSPFLFLIIIITTTLWFSFLNRITAKSVTSSHLTSS